MARRGFVLLCAENVSLFTDKLVRSGQLGFWLWQLPKLRVQLWLSTFHKFGIIEAKGTL
jgi:hypothetical protein